MAIFSVPLINKCLVLKDIFEFHFAKPKDWSFIAGQYTNLILPASPDLPAEHRARRFSPIDTTSDDHLIITTRIFNGSCSPYKQALHHLPIGGEVRISNAQGQFTLPTESSSRRITFIAGGIGITPFLSMLRYPASRSLPIHLFYLNYSAATAIYLPELQQLASEQPNFTLSHIESEAFEHPQEAFTVIEQTLLSSPEWLDGWFYLCGSPGMVNDGQRFLIQQLEINQAFIKVEEFSGY